MFGCNLSAEDCCQQQGIPMSKNIYLSHEHAPKDFKDVLDEVRQRIRREAKTSQDTTKNLALVDELAAFPLGRFLLTHRGANGYWTRYMANMDPQYNLTTGINPEGKPFSKLERWLLTRSRGAYALPRRMHEAQGVLQPMLYNDIVLASLPCGAMDDLLGLDFTDVKTFKLVGIDVDPESIKLAASNAASKKLTDNVELIEKDAWSLDVENQFDALVCHGLTGYIADTQRVLQLYKIFHRALKKPKGVFITNLTVPYTRETTDTKEDIEDAKHHHLIFEDILHFKTVNNRRSVEKTHKMLSQAGFSDLQITIDPRGICFTIIATC